MCSLPQTIDDIEAIARCVMSPYHTNKGQTKIKAAAFRPKSGTDDLSVIRHSLLDSSACKLKGKALESIDKKFRGLGILSARQIRNRGSSIHDSRDVYYGHAHIESGFIPTKDEPVPAEIAERWDSLARTCAFYIDCTPNEEAWAGPQNLPYLDQE